MKRNWRLMRFLVAALLLGLAGLMVFAWPVGLHWRKGAEQLLGFDLRRDLLLTIINPQGGESCELHGLNVDNGKQRFNTPVRGENGTPLDLSKWTVVLSSDGNTLACYDGATSIQLFDVRGGCQWLFTDKSQHNIDGLALTWNGELYAYSSGNEVQVWNRHTRRLIHTLNLPETSAAAGGTVSVKKTVQFNSDSLLLAVANGQGSMFVFDMKTGQMLGQCSGATTPLFFEDNKTIVAMPGFNRPGKFEWHHLEDGKLVPASLPKPFHSEPATLLAACSTKWLTIQPETAAHPSLPAWLPEGMRNNLEAALGWTKNAQVVRSYGVFTGQLRDEFKIKAQNITKAIVSLDGMLLATEDGENISLWDVSPKRSITCWLVCGGMAVVAVLLVWPKRKQPVKEQS